jgi:hypothetical protein
MKRFLTAVGLISLMFGTHMAGASPQSPAMIAKQQLSECMTKRMSANRTLSYNDARRACQERSQPPKDTLASINPMQPGTTKAH